MDQMNITFNVEKQKFDTEGYLLLKNVFTKEEVAQMRADTYSQFELDTKKNLTYRNPSKLSNAKFANGDLLSKDLLRKYLLDDRILYLVKKVLGSDLVYYGDSSYQLGTGFRGFHRDNVDRTDMTAPDWQDGNYPIIRLAVYMQDHKRYSGGLKIRIGSHIHASGKPIFIDSEEGDVVIWNLKTIHSGNAVRFKFFKNLMVNKARREGMIPSFLKKDEQRERVAFFMSFAVKSNHLDRYIQKIMVDRKDHRDHLVYSRFDPKVFEIAKQKNLEVIKIVPEYGTL